MAKVILDTNIIIDYLSASRPRHGDAADLLGTLLSSDDKEPAILASSIKDAYYILCRHYQNEPVVRERLDAFRHVVEVMPLDDEVLDGAFASDEPDLEDAMVRSAAELCGAEAIITRDASAYRKSRVPSMDARAYCMRLG